MAILVSVSADGIKSTPFLPNVVSRPSLSVLSLTSRTHSSAVPDTLTSVLPARMIFDGGTSWDEPPWKAVATMLGSVAPEIEQIHTGAVEAGRPFHRRVECAVEIDQAIGIAFALGELADPVTRIVFDVGVFATVG